MDLEGKVAIVTGASAGIGRAYALALAGAGATVVAAARTLGRVDGEAPARNTLAEVVAAGQGLPGRIYAQVCDLQIESDLVEMVDGTAANFGRIDVLVNNAALLWQFDSLQIAGDEWEEVMRTNVRAPYLTIRQAAPHMMRQRSGSIINITALAGTFAPTTNHNGMLAYAVSKAHAQPPFLFHGGGAAGVRHCGQLPEPRGGSDRHRTQSQAGGGHERHPQAGDPRGTRPGAALSGSADPRRPLPARFSTPTSFSRAGPEGARVRSRPQVSGLRSHSAGLAYPGGGVPMATTLRRQPSGPATHRWSTPFTTIMSPGWSEWVPSSRVSSRLPSRSMSKSTASVWCQVPLTFGPKSTICHPTSPGAKPISPRSPRPGGRAGGGTDEVAATRTPSNPSPTVSKTSVVCSTRHEWPDSSTPATNFRMATTSLTCAGDSRVATPSGPIAGPGTLQSGVASASSPAPCLAMLAGPGMP